MARTPTKVRAPQCFRTTPVASAEVGKLLWSIQGHYVNPGKGGVSANQRETSTIKGVRVARKFVYLTMGDYRILKVDKTATIAYGY